mmetsp:Transcript_106573/g.311534  ORF Transcript_106573/g.311534 Transcript_106573/m.311534 type:complete len:438 (-) Transcript_106573:3009-4322(-)
MARDQLPCRRRTRQATLARIYLHMPEARLIAAVARRRAPGPFGPLGHHAVLGACTLALDLAAVGFRLALGGVAPLSLLCCSLAGLPLPGGVHEDAPRAGAVAVAVGGTRRCLGPLAEDAVLVLAAVGGLTAIVLRGRACRRLPAPRLLHPELPAAHPRALATSRRAGAPLLPRVPLAVDAALRLSLTVDHRADLLPDPWRAEVPSSAGHRLDLPAALLEADSAHVGGRHAVGPALPLGPLAVHRSTARLEFAVLGLLQSTVAALGTERGRLGDAARPRHVSLSAGDGAVAPFAPPRELADSRLCIGTRRFTARRIFQQGALALQAVPLGVGLDAPRAGVLRSATRLRAGGPHAPGREDAVLVHRRVHLARPGLVQPALARETSRLCLAHQDPLPVGLLPAWTLALAPQRPRAKLAVPGQPVLRAAAAGARAAGPDLG